jgi:hypothetical protein
MDTKKLLFRAVKLCSLAEVDSGTQSGHLWVDVKAKQATRKKEHHLV